MSWVDGDDLSPANLNAKSGLVFNVKDEDYGAVGDGVTDDRTAIVAAVAAAGIGGIVYFPAGDYRFSTEIVIPGFQRWVGETFELGAGTSSATALTYTGSSGVGIRVSGSTNIIWENLVYQNSALTYTDATFSTAGSTAYGFSLTGNIIAQGCVFRSWYRVFDLLESYYCKFFSCQFSRCETAFVASSQVFNLELHGVSTNLVNVVTAGSGGFRIENLKVLGGSHEGFRAAFNGIVDASFFGTYFETTNTVDTNYGFFSDAPPDDVALRLYGCKVFLNYLDRFVNLSGLGNATFVSMGNSLEVGITKAASGANHVYVVPPTANSGRLTMAGDALTGRGAVNVNQLTYISSLVGRQTDHIAFPHDDPTIPFTGGVFLPPVRTQSLSITSAALTLPSATSSMGYFYVDSASSLYWVNGSAVSTLIV